jgi:menaquinol-cytochrome c reductase iron-sulfur subunit
MISTDPLPHNNPGDHPEPVINTSREGHSRRVFLFKLSLVINGLVGAIIGVPLVGYLLGSAWKKAGSDNAWINLGPLSDFPEGETRLVSFRNPVTTPWDGQTGDIPCWVRRISGEQFQVFAINCAHLGCPVRWFAQSKLFMCPCHGGAYYADGSRASGPPERGLFEYQHKISNGSLIISAGQMPTLANEARTQAPSGVPLIQIDGAAPAASVLDLQPPKPRCGSCQS